jgi:hypothetical protein
MKQDKLLVGILIAVTVLLGVMYAKVVMDNSVTITVNSPKKANLFVFALYPDGFRNIGYDLIPN